MGYADFKGIWKIVSTAPPTGVPRDIVGDWIAIGGSNQNAVQVVCVHHRGHIYGVGSFKPGDGTNPDRIEGPPDDPYKITITGGVMKCESLLRDPGSWTANDSLPWYAEGEEHEHGGS